MAQLLLLFHVIKWRSTMRKVAEKKLLKLGRHFFIQTLYHEKKKTAVLGVFHLPSRQVSKVLGLLTRSLTSQFETTAMLSPSLSRNVASLPSFQILLWLLLSTLARLRASLFGKAAPDRPL